jgi:hypothetical protein
MNLKTIAAVVIICLLVAVVSGLLVRQIMINNSGNVRAVDIGIFNDSACTIKTSHIDWGDISIEENGVILIYAKNTGNLPVDLSYIVTDYLPLEYESLLVLTWDYSGETLNAGQMVPVILTLKLLNNPSGGNYSFSFITTFIGTQV